MPRPHPFDAGRLLRDLARLASPAFAGRCTGTEGAESARRLIEARFAEIGLEPLAAPGFRHPFGGDTPGINLVGHLPGADPEARWLVVLAHYDHLGEEEGEVYPGADDNASGVAVLLATAEALAVRPGRHPVLFVCPDAEEWEQAGSRALVAAPPIDLDDIDLVINLDMLSRSTAGELWVAGTAYFPELLARVAAAAARSTVAVRTGHDRPDEGRADWSADSDHAAFHAAGVPWLYFGVEDHDDYHTPDDTFERIDESFFLGAAATVVDFVADLARDPRDAVGPGLAGTDGA